MIPIHGNTRVFAVIGNPVKHSLSPVMLNAAFSALGIEAVYIAVEVDERGLGDVMRGFEAAGIAGNVTVPHKVHVADVVARKTGLATQVGAVNTFWPEDGGMMGDNTDVGGVLDALDAVRAEGPWLVAGTGGSARAVAAASHAASVPLLVQSRDANRAADFAAWARNIGADAQPDDGRHIGAAINATPLGLGPDDPAPIAKERMEGCPAVLDLVYVPGETAWTLAARADGKRAADGRGVLVGQGVRAFKRFFPDLSAPREVMHAAVERSLTA